MMLYLIAPSYLHTHQYRSMQHIQVHIHISVHNMSSMERYAACTYSVLEGLLRVKKIELGKLWNSTSAVKEEGHFTMMALPIALTPIFGHVLFGASLLLRWRVNAHQPPKFLYNFLKTERERERLLWSGIGFIRPIDWSHRAFDFGIHRKKCHLWWVCSACRAPVVLTHPGSLY